jgi:hypothetical protein
MGTAERGFDFGCADTLAPGAYVRSSSTGIAGAQEHGRISTCAPSLRDRMMMQAAGATERTRLRASSIDDIARS